MGIQMSRWTIEDEINLQRWVNAKGFEIVYMPSVCEWGFIDKKKPGEINGGFKHLSELKQHFVNLKGDKKSIHLVSEGDFQKAVADFHKHESKVNRSRKNLRLVK